MAAQRDAAGLLQSPSTSGSQPAPGATLASNRQLIAELLQGLRADAPQTTIEACQALLAREPQSPAAHFAIGITAAMMGDLATGAAMLEAAHKRDAQEPLYAEALAVVYALAGRLGECVYFGKLSAALGCDETVQAMLPDGFPPFTDAFLLVSERPLLAQGEQQLAQGLFAAAADKFNQQLTFESDCAPARRGLARCLLALGEPWAAVTALQPSETAAPLEALDFSLAGEAYAALGDATEARALHRKAQDLAPKNIVIAGAALRDSVLYPDIGLDGPPRALAEWAERFGKSPSANAAASPGGGAKIRVGYLATAFADTRDQELLAQLAGGHDRARFEVFAYATGAETDPLNSDLKGRFDVWRDCSGVDGPTLAMMLSSDRIDAAIDCAGLWSPMQLQALTRRPVRLRLSWLGNPAGLAPAIFDAALDQRRIAPGAPVRPSASATGEFCFGAAVTMAQLHPDLCAAWAEILRAAPNASLLLNARGLKDPQMVQRLVQRFLPHGVADRVDLVDLSGDEFLATISVVLAPFAAMNAWFEAEALARAIPVVALDGGTLHRRQAALAVRDAGLAQCIGADVSAYLGKALTLAQTPAALDELRAELIAAQSRAPLFQSAAFAGAIETRIVTLLQGRP